MTQNRAGSRASAGTPAAAASPPAKASSITVASSVFFSLARACAQASAQRGAGNAQHAALGDARPKQLRRGRTWVAKTMPSRATVASNSGRAPCSKASWPFSVRATQAANSARLSASGNARSAVKASSSSCLSSQSTAGTKGRPTGPRRGCVARRHRRSCAAAADPGLPDGDIERIGLVAAGEHRAAHLEQQEVEAASKSRARCTLTRVVRMARRSSASPMPTPRLPCAPRRGGRPEMPQGRRSPAPQACRARLRYRPFRRRSRRPCVGHVLGADEALDEAQFAVLAGWLRCSLRSRGPPPGTRPEPQATP